MTAERSYERRDAVLTDRLEAAIVRTAVELKTQNTHVDIGYRPPS